MPSRSSKVAGAAAALVLLGSPAGAMSSRPTAQGASASNAWSTLGVMSSASSSSAALAAGQGDPDYRGGVAGIPLPVLAVWLATAALFIWILVHDDDDDDSEQVDLSPE